MKSKYFLFIFTYLLPVISLSCGDQNQILEPIPPENPLLGIWENKVYHEGYKDTSFAFYHFKKNSSFEFGSFQFKYGEYQDTLFEGGEYSSPAPFLLILNYSYGRRGRDTLSPIEKIDTIVYKKEWVVYLILCGEARAFKQISGKPGTLFNSTYYGTKKYYSRYAHNKYVFKEDSLYFYSHFSSTASEPDSWSAPFKYRINISRPQLIYYLGDGSTYTTTYALYHNNLIITYTEQKYTYKY